MSDLVLVAATSASSAVLGVLATSLASIFGPAWQAAATRKHEIESERVRMRRSALDGYVDAITALAFAPDDTRQEFVEPGYVARNKLSSVLTADETAVQVYASGLLRQLERTFDFRASSLMAGRGSDDLNAWYRGSLSVNDLKSFAANRTDKGKLELIEIGEWP
jgi:hypothetical protein